MKFRTITILLLLWRLFSLQEILAVPLEQNKRSLSNVPPEPHEQILTTSRNETLRTRRKRGEKRIEVRKRALAQREARAETPPARPKWMPSNWDPNGKNIHYWQSFYVYTSKFKPSYSIRFTVHHSSSSITPNFTRVFNVSSADVLDPESVNFIRSVDGIEQKHAVCFKTYKTFTVGVTLASDEKACCVNLNRDENEVVNIRAIFVFNKFPHLFQHQILNAVPSAGMAWGIFRTFPELFGSDVPSEDGELLQTKFIVREADGFAVRSLEAVGVNSSQIEVFRHEVRYKEVWWPYPRWVPRSGAILPAGHDLTTCPVSSSSCWNDGVGPVDTYPKGVYDEFVLALKKQAGLIGEGVSKEGDFDQNGPLIYLKRVDAGSKSRHGLSRRIRDQEKLVQKLRDLATEHGKDFAMFEFENKMSTKEVMTLFHSASLVVSIHGGALTNIVWCRPQTAVIEIMPTPEDCAWFRYCFASLAFNRRLRYYTMTPGRQPTEFKFDYWFKNRTEAVEVDLNEIGSLVRKVFRDTHVANSAAL